MSDGNYRFDFLLATCNLVIASVPSSRLRHAFYRYVMQIDLARTAHVFSGLWLDCRGHLKIGENSVINQRCRLDNRGGITIGANVSISPEVHILTADHDVHSVRLIGRTHPIHIEDHVFIGSRAMILPGVTLGSGCAVAAGSVVTKNVEPQTIVAGVPAKPIGQRPSEVDYICDGRRHFL